VFVIDHVAPPPENFGADTALGLWRSENSGDKSYSSTSFENETFTTSALL
jgi:hypothetical protein